jgi:hypothetical protein
MVPVMSAGPFARLRRLSGERRRLLVEAAALLVSASAVVAVLPFRFSIRFGCVPVRREARGALEDIVWAVETAARRLPWKVVCIEKGLVAQRMLRGAGIDAVLHYGARQTPSDGRLEAHVWVTVDGCAVIGGEEAAGFAAVATYP